MKLNYQSINNRLFCILFACICAVGDANCQDNTAKVRELVNKGNYFLGRKAFQDALNLYKQALELDPKNSVASNNIVETHNTWGIFYYQHKKYPEAMKEWQEAVKLNPNHYNAKHNIVLLKQILDRQNITIDENGELRDTTSLSNEKNEASNKNVIGEKNANTEKVEKIEKKAGELTPQLAPVNEETSAVRILTPLSKSNSNQAAEIQNYPTNEPAVLSNQPSAQENKILPSSQSDTSLEEQLASVEMKVYGKRLSDTTFLQRIEKLEMATSGQIRTGTIKERINYLLKSYGLQ